jgi:hypothetical protein
MWVHWHGYLPLHSLSHARANIHVKSYHHAPLLDSISRPINSNVLLRIRDQGPMFWSQFSRFLTIFGEKIGVFIKNQCYYQNFS